VKIGRLGASRRQDRGGLASGRFSLHPAGDLLEHCYLMQ
jgi:hypothetical protein